jgi:hypothetical protein
MGGFWVDLTQMLKWVKIGLRSWVAEVGHHHPSHSTNLDTIVSSQRSSLMNLCIALRVSWHRIAMDFHVPNKISVVCLSIPPPMYDIASTAVANTIKKT